MLEKNQILQHHVFLIFHRFGLPKRMPNRAFFPSFFENIDLAKSLQNTGCAQKNQGSDFKKSLKNRFNNALSEGIAKNFQKIDF